MSQPVIIHHSAEPYNRVITAHPMAIEGLKAMLHTTAPDLLLVMHLGQPVPVGTNCVMPLLYRHPQLVHAAPVSSELKDEPVVVPLMHFMFEVQEKDTLEIIVDFFFRKAAEFLKKKCPEFLARPKILVSTRDFRQECRFPNTKRAFCWDELIKDFTRKAIQTGLSPRTETFRNLVDSVRNLMQSGTVNDYEKKRDNLFGKNPLWTSEQGKQMSEFYRKSMDKDIVERAGQWHLKNIGLKNPLSGVTNKPAELYSRQLVQALGD